MIPTLLAIDIEHVILHILDILPRHLQVGVDGALDLVRFLLDQREAGVDAGEALVA